MGMPMEEEITDVVVVPPLGLDVSFANGKRVRLDVSSELNGEIFLPLRNPDYFAEGKYDPLAGTIVWPNGADFSPEFLNELSLTASS